MPKARKKSHFAHQQAYYLGRLERVAFYRIQGHIQNRVRPKGEAAIFDAN